MKKCSRCQIEKKIDCFNRNTKAKDGKSWYCKECISKISKEIREKDPEKDREKSRKYRKENPEKVKQISRSNYLKYHEEKKQKQREYYWKNHEEILKKANAKTKTESFKQTVKKYREKNKEKIKNQYKAHMLVKYAIELGILIRPEECTECKMKCKPEGHHKDYQKALEVVWVCKKCHRKIEKGSN